MVEHDSGQGAVFEVFEARPPSSYIERVRSHIAATGMPESFPGLHPGPVGKGEPFRILSPISIPRNKRPDGKMAPCPRCHCRDKFLEGQLVWFWELQAIAIVGHCCASAQQSSEAIAEYRQREARERAEDYLLEWLCKAPAMLAVARGLEAPVAECQRVFDRFRKDGAKFHQALRKATRGDTQLTVTETIGPAVAGGPAGMRTSGSNIETRDVQFGRLAGASVVATKCTMAEDLAACTATLERLEAHATDDGILEFVAPLSDEEKTATATALRLAVEGLAAVEDGLADFRRFFADANLERITRWGTQAESPTPMKASLAPYGDTPLRRLFEIKGEGGRRLGIIIEGAFWGDSVSARAA